MGVNKGYDWHILTVINEADKVAYGVLDKLASADANLKLAIRKLRPRVTQAS
jgi:hypothetical protein